MPIASVLYLVKALVGLAPPRNPRPLVPLPDRGPGQPLPEAPGVYLYSKAECMGKCFRLDGYNADLEAETVWPVKSAHVVRKGDFWNGPRPSKTRIPDREVHADPRQVTFDTSPRAANKLED
jgi:hypothetical protein